MVIKIFVLAKNHRVVNRHRLQQHAVSVLRRGRRQHDQSGKMRVNSFQALAVKRPAPGGPARWHADGDGTRHFRPPKKRRRLIDNLRQTRRRKIGELHFDDGAHSLDGRPNRRADNGILADRSIQHPPRKFRRQILGRLERAAKRAHVLSVNKNTRILGQCPGLRGADGFKISDAHIASNTG